MKRAKKKSKFSSVLLGGCGAAVFVVLAIVGTVLFIVWKKSNEYLSHPEMFEAEHAVAASPDLEIAGVDAENGMMTIRHKESGETMTLSAVDIRDGNFSFPSHEGEESAKADAKGEADKTTLVKIVEPQGAKER